MKIVKATVNWSLLLTIPIWGGGLMLAMMISGIIKGDAGNSAVLKGRRWLWE